MRILTLANTPLDPRTGSGYVICGYAERLRRLGVEVELRGPSDLEPLYGWRRAIGYRQALGMAIASWRSRHDVIEFYGGEAWLAIQLLRRRKRRPLLVCHSNGLETHAIERSLQASDSARNERLPFSFRLYAQAFRGCDALVTVGQFDATYALSHRYVQSDRLLAVDNPLPESYIGLPLTSRREQRIGFCGSWIPRKGIDRLVNEAGAVLRAHPEWRLTLVGVGSAVRPEEVFPVDILGQVEVIPHAARDEELRRLYSTMSILVVPSLYESFGLVAAEAMACGCALVASPVGFASGLKPDEEVVLIDEKPGSLSGSVLRLISDESLRARIAATGYLRVQELRWQPAVETLLATYSRWLEEHRRAA